jgi:alpha-tubulin suppressor-like RCC1 family protein
VASLATAGLVVSLLGVASPAGATGSTAVTGQAVGRAAASVPAASPRVASRQKSSCVDALVVAIDGNGQGKGARPGGAVGAVTRRLEGKANGQGRTVAVRRLRLSTPAAGVLVGKRGGASSKAISKAGLRKWKKPINKGVRKTRELVAGQLSACPEQQVLLVGYAQGAAVAHRVLQDLRSSGRLANVAGGVLISDPWRVKKSTTGRPLGSPGASSTTEGVLTRMAKPVGDVPTTAGTFGAVAVCHKGDLVCNPGKTPARAALSKALSYAKKSSNPPMKAAADRAWAQLSLWPVPASQQLTVAADTAISQQLQVRGGSATTPAATWSAVSLPAGLSLSSTGVLSGRISAPGVHEVRYTVAGVSPATTAKTGVLLVSVRAPSGALSAAGMTSCEVRSDATAWCWGRNDFGQIGDGTNTLRTNPAQVQGTGWARVSTGGSFTCGVKLDGTLWCWGLNNFGQLGGADRATSLVPRQVGAGNTWREVAASWSHACALSAEGALACWGQNVHGQLGVGKTAMRSNSVARVIGNQTWASVAVGGQNTCAATTSGAGFCWGNNAFGQVGDGTTTTRVRPVAVKGGMQFASFSLTWGRTCGLTPGGDAWCWGENSHGELGDGTRTDASVPVAVPSAGAAWAQVATGNQSTCATRTDGQVYCWGDNRYGQLGPGNSATFSTTTPSAAGIVSTGALISAGWYHFCSVGGGCWGTNDAGQLGNGAITPVTVPAKAAPWGPNTPLTHQQVRKWGARKIAQTAIASRPSVNARARGRKSSFAVDVMTFNLLGSQHTAPTGGRPAYAPGRVRSEWARNIIERRGSTLIGLSEPQPDQIAQLTVATGGAYSIYPGNSFGYDAAPQSVMWKDSEWDFVWGNTAQMPFMRKSRPQAVVRLRHKGTGRELYWINAHLSPGKMQADRDKGMAIIVQLVKQLNRDGLPVLVTGDLNEHGKAFRRIACKTNLTAAIGGVATTKKCKVPKAMRVDWIFGSKGKWSGTIVDTSPRVRRTTDHAVVSSRLTVQ